MTVALDSNKLPKKMQSALWDSNSLPRRYVKVWANTSDSSATPGNR